MSFAAFFEFLEQTRVGFGILASAATLFSTGIGVGYWYGTRYHRQKQRELREQIQQIQDGLRDDTFLWMQNPISQPPSYVEDIRSSIPVLTVANLKGGVGKTTLVANLAAYFNFKEKRVLLIDLDYQGSLSSLMSLAGGQVAVQEVALKCLKAGANPAELRNATLRLDAPLRRVDLVTATDLLASEETKLMLDWFLAKKKSTDAVDARYVLHGYLSSAAFQEAYDLIMIDTPPRFTTGFINALCASTYLLVPTHLNILSAQAVPRFLKQVEEMRPKLFACLKTLGVVGQMVRYADQLTPDEKQAVETMRLRLKGEGLHNVEVFVQESIRSRAAFARSAQGHLTYVHDREARAMFNRLGDAISERIGL